MPAGSRVAAHSSVLKNSRGRAVRSPLGWRLTAVGRNSVKRLADSSRGNGSEPGLRELTNGAARQPSPLEPAQMAFEQVEGEESRVG